MRSTRTACSTTMRLLFLGVAAVLVLGGGLPTLHLATHRHAICPEHGELVDNDGAHSVDHSRHVAASHADPDPAGGESHVHCGVLGALTPNACANEARAELSAALHTLTDSWANSSSRMLTHSALSRAPKTSPPA